jgi:hypothetical protein
MPRYRWADDKHNRVIVKNEDTGDEYVVNVGSPEYNQINQEQIEPPEDEDEES